jgi:hypothetical protein
MKRIFLPAILTSLFAGPLDIAVVMLRYYGTTGKDPLGILRFIASGFFGRKVFAGGTTAGILWIGLSFFYCLLSDDRFHPMIRVGETVPGKIIPNIIQLEGSDIFFPSSYMQTVRIAAD